MLIQTRSIPDFVGDPRRHFSDLFCTYGQTNQNLDHTPSRDFDDAVIHTKGILLMAT